MLLTILPCLSWITSVFSKGKTILCLDVWRFMMVKLTESSCIACRSDSPMVTDKEITQLMTQVPDWDIIDDEGVGKLEKDFQFENFVQALEFSNKVGELAENENHHPAILVEWGRVTVTWWTHKIGGLHHNDFVAASKTDQLFA